jgi:hypothetical protein
MSFLQKIQLRLYNYFLSQKLKNSKVDRKAVSFDKAKRIGILFDATNPDNEVIVSAYKHNLQNSGKQVDMLAYVDDKLEHNTTLFKYFNRKNLNWSLQPTSSIVEQFIETPFDILLNLHIDTVPPLEYVSALSKAHLRVGQFRDDKEYCYDLMIDIPEEDNLGNFISQLDALLKAINKQK